MLERCPPTSELADFSRGEIAEESAVAIAEHLDTCQSCLETVANFDAAGDALVEQLRVPSPELLHHGESGLAQLQPHLRNLIFFSVQSNDRVDLELTWLREYELLEQIGAGGMGTVYRARHSKLDRIVAVKVLPLQRMTDAAAVARFEREIRAVAKLDHPNIVRALDAGEIEETHFLVMEFVNGSDLSKICEQRGPLPIAEACEIICQAAGGLAVAHKHGIVHRDVKPSNLMLANTMTNDGTSSVIVKVLDLGLALLDEVHASVGDQATSSDRIMGTLEFMAPEQCANSHEVDQRADVYSLGVTLYKLLCGESPFSSHRYSSFGKRFHAITNVIPPPVRKVRPGVPAKLSKYIDRMLAKSPGHRPANVQEVAGFLSQFTSGADLTGLLTADVAERNEAESVTLTMMQGGSTTKNNMYAVKQAPARRWLQFLAAVAATVILVIVASVGWTHLGVGRKTDTSSSEVPDLDPVEKTKRTISTDTKDRPPIAIAPFDSIQARKYQQAWADYLHLPLEKNVKLPDETLLTFVLIPPGEFKMGASDEEYARSVEAARELGVLADVEGLLQSTTPQHTVKLSEAFYLGKFELTQRQWNSIYDENPSLFAGNPDRPVEQVEYHEIKQYITDLNALLPQKDSWFALPTEAQWEYACRAGTESLWSMGETDEDLAKYAWYIYNSDNHSRDVGQLLPNAFGLYDMYGNVWEFCHDWYSPDYYRTSSSHDPLGPAYGARRIHRGGGYCDTPLQCTVIYREGTLPSEHPQGHKGFRLALVFDRPVATQQADIDREVATWVLARAGRVWTDVSPNEPIASVASLPKTPFKVVRVDVTSPYIGNNLSKLTSLEHLEHFDSRNHDCTDETLRHLSQIPTLHWISLIDAEITGEGLEHLQALPDLLSLNLASTTIKDEDLRALAPISTLRVLNLSSTQVTSEGMVHLKELEMLTNLLLGETAVNDAGLEQLKGLKQLSGLNLYDTDVTREGVADFKKARPNCHVPTSWDKAGKMPATRSDDNTSPSLNVSDRSLAPPIAIAPFDARQAKEHQQAWAEYLDCPVEFENSIGMKFRLIPPGKFQMGNSDDFVNFLKNTGMPDDLGPTQPQHSVTLSRPYYIGVHEVTQSQYAAVSPGIPDGQPVFGDDYPVTKVKWDDAHIFCEQLSRLDGLQATAASPLQYILPTEAQWEFACLAGAETLLTFDTHEDFRVGSQDYAWHSVNSRDTKSEKNHHTSSVGTLKPNRFGLHDMRGNVLEMCYDFYAADYFQQLEGVNVVDPRGPETGEQRVFRGGHYPALRTGFLVCEIWRG